MKKERGFWEYRGREWRLDGGVGKEQGRREINRRVWGIGGRGEYWDQGREMGMFVKK